MKYVIITNSWNDKASVIKVDQANAKENLIKNYLKLYMNSNTDKEHSYMDKDYAIITTKDNQKIELFIV